jgi:hypothetical protein
MNFLFLKKWNIFIYLFIYKKLDLIKKETAARIQKLQLQFPLGG